MRTTPVFLLLQTHFVAGFVATGRSENQRPIDIGFPRRCRSGTFSSGVIVHNSNNPFTSMIGDFVASTLGGNSNPVSTNTKIDSALEAISISSWSEVRSQLESLQTPEEQKFRENLRKGYGVGSPLHLTRLFSEENKEEDIRVTFYRDSASWCPYCQKVWLTLEEKKIPYKVEKINMRCYGEKPSSFLRLQPGGQIPVAIIDGKTYGQSNDILVVLEEAFPDHKSLKPSKELTQTAQQYFRLERQLFSAWMYWLTGNDFGGGAQREFIEVLKIVEMALERSDGPFFLGKDISQVDVMFTPFLERMAASLLFFKGFMMRVPAGTKTDYPALNKWFDAMEELPSYQLTKSDYYTHCWDLPPQLGGCTYEEAGKKYEDAINGIRSFDGTQGSWELPLQPHNGGIEPDWTWTGDDAAARREAVERLSANHEAIVGFAARGAGKKGMPPYMAALSDPNAVPNENIQPVVDQILRSVCTAMLNDGIDEKDEAIMNETVTVMKNEAGGKDYASAAIASLTYLRDRVGVPRDMKLPAARQLRAHLNWAIGKLLEV